MSRPFATTGSPFGRVTMRSRSVSSGTEASPSIVDLLDRVLGTRLDHELHDDGIGARRATAATFAR